MPTGALLKSNPAFTSDGSGVLFLGADEQDLSRSDVYLASESGAPVRLTDQAGHKANVVVGASGTGLTYSVAQTTPFRLLASGQAAGPGQAAGADAGRGGGRGAGGGAGQGRTGGAPPAAAAGGGVPAGPNPCGGGGRGGGAAPTFGVVDLAAKTTRIVTGSGATISADGRTIAWLNRNGDACELTTAAVAGGGAPKVVRSERRIDAPTLSPDGTQIAYQAMTNVDWEIYVADQAGTTRRLTRDIQHDVLPRFLPGGKLIAMMGEPRHRRSHVYDVATGARQRLFANNTIRTITPEYIWLPSADGSRVLIQAERDGDTVSVERGVYVVDLTRKVTAADAARPSGSATRGGERPAGAHDEGLSTGRQARAGGG